MSMKKAKIYAVIGSLFLSLNVAYAADLVVWEDIGKAHGIEKAVAQFEKENNCKVILKDSDYVGHLTAYEKAVSSNHSLPVWCRQYSKRLPAKVPEFKCGEHRKEEDDDRVCKRRGNGISDTDIYSDCLACTCVDGKRIHPDGKELQKGRYEPGSGVRICGISKRTSGTL